MILAVVIQSGSPLLQILKMTPRRFPSSASTLLALVAIAAGLLMDAVPRFNGDGKASAVASLAQAVELSTAAACLDDSLSANKHRVGSGLCFSSQQDSQPAETVSIADISLDRKPAPTLHSLGIRLQI